MTEVQKRSRVESQQYEGVLRVIDAKGKTSEKGWTYERLGSHGASKVIIRFTAPAEVKGVALLVRELSGSRLRPVDVDAGHQPRAPDRHPGSPLALLRHRFQLRGSRGTRRRAVRLRDAGRGDARGRGVLEDRRHAACRQAVAVHARPPTGCARTPTPTPKSRTSTRNA